MLKKIVLFLGLFMTIVVAGMAMFIYTSGPEITEDMEHTIKAAIKSPVPQLTVSTGFANNGDTQIWYEVLEPEDSVKGTLLLIMGLSADALAWPEYFMDPFVEAGYRVIRFDNRGVGMSDWNAFDPENPYSLSDMSDDAFAVLDALEIKNAHVAGVSLGGMICQTMSIEHPERVESLSSIMSTPWIMDTTLPSINMDCVKELVLSGIKYGTIESEMNAVKQRIAVRTILMGSEKYDLDIKAISHLTLYNLRERKGYNGQSGQQQTKAVETSGSRVEELQKLNLPTLVVHGKSDPLIPFVHGKKTAELIPNSETLWIDGMGHTLPEMYSDTVVKRMLILMNRALEEL